MQNLVRSVGQSKGTESVNKVRDVEIVLKVLEDRVSKGVDKAERTDVTARLSMSLRSPNQRNLTHRLKTRSRDGTRTGADLPRR
jgi:tryptophan 2,3-dioxygenase